VLNWLEVVLSWLISHEEAIRGWAVAFGTLFLALVAYKQIIESRLQRKIEKHTEELKGLFSRWHKELPPVPITGAEVYEFESSGFKWSDDLSFEDTPLFSDLKNHLPAKFENLMEKWGQYKKLRKEYYQKQQEIVDKVRAKIEELNYKFPPGSVYLRAIHLLTNKTYYYDYRSKSMRLPIPYNDRYYVYYETTCGDGYLLSPKDGGTPEEEIDNLKEHHENISSIIKTKYEKDFRNLIDIEHKLRVLFDELKDSLNKLTGYVEYLNMTLSPSCQNY